MKRRTLFASVVVNIDAPGLRRVLQHNEELGPAPDMLTFLDFEKPIAELEAKIDVAPCSNERFRRPAPYEEVCLGAEQHAGADLPGHVPLGRGQPGDVAVPHLDRDGGAIPVLDPRLTPIRRMHPPDASAGLAPVLIDRVLEVVKSLRAKGAAILLIEQAVEKALSVADRVYVMVHGKLVLDTDARSASAHGVLEAAYLGSTTTHQASSS